MYDCEYDQSYHHYAYKYDHAQLVTNAFYTSCISVSDLPCRTLYNNLLTELEDIDDSGISLYSLVSASGTMTVLVVVSFALSV